MAASQTTVTGPVYLPNCEKPNNAKVVFELSSWDQDQGEAVIVTGPYVATIDVNGDFTATVFTTAEGENAVVYRVYVSYIDDTGLYKNEYLGTIGLSGAGPFKLADLAFITEWDPNSFDVLAQVEAARIAAELAATNAAASIVTLDAYEQNVVDDFDALETIDLADLVVGSFWRVLYGDSYFKVVTTGEILTLGNGAKLTLAITPVYDVLNTANATEFVKYPNTVIGTIASILYVVDSTKTGAASATDGVGVDGTDLVAVATTIQDVLDTLAVQIATRAPTVHTHTLSDISDGGTMSRLGAYARTITDWDDAVESGWFMAVGATNAPTITVGYIGHVQAIDANNCTQYAHSYTEDGEANSYKYRRDMNSSAWGSWIRVYETLTEITDIIDSEGAGQVKSLHTIQSPCATYRSGGVIMKDDSIRVWGSGSSYQLGLGVITSDQARPSKPAFPFGFTGTITKIVRAGQASFAILSNGDVYSWGINSTGWLGHGNTANYGEPTKISALNGITIVDIQLGFHPNYLSGHALFLTDTGTVYSCGNNTQGELGLGDTTQRTTPVALTKTDWVSIKAGGSGYGTGLGIDTNGDLYTWGYNGYNGLGDGTATNRSSPTFINSFGGANIAFANLGVDGAGTAVGQCSLAILDTGELYTWGQNSNGELGVGDTTARTIPTLISGMSTNNVSGIANPYNSKIIITKSNGEVWGSGYNGKGILGQGDLVSTTSFVLIAAARAGVTIIDTIMTGGSTYSGIAILYSDGMIQVCGYNGNGELGVGHTGNVTSVVPMLFPDYNDKPVAIVGVGYNTEAGIGILTEKGNYWQTGYNTSGQGGIGGTSYLYVPAKVNF